jgi:hypothetical protein
VFLTEDIADVVAFAAADTPFIIIAAAALLVFSLVFTDVIVYLHAKKVFLYFVIINSPLHCSLNLFHDVSTMVTETSKKFIAKNGEHAELFFGIESIALFSSTFQNHNLNNTNITCKLNYLMNF